MKNYLSNFFKPKPPPPKTVDDLLSDIEEKLVEDLALAKEQGHNNSWSNEEINTHILSLEKIDELREKRDNRKNKSFLNSPAGASVLTAVITITATQFPALTQMFMAREAEARKMLSPIFEVVAKDDSLSLDEKMAMLEFVSSSAYRHETVEEYLDRYRAEITEQRKYRRRISGSHESAGAEDDDPNKANTADAKKRAAD